MAAAASSASLEVAWYNVALVPMGEYPAGQSFGWQALLRLRPNGLRISRRERAAQDRVKKPPISRAKRSAALPGWAANGNLLY